jgi:hypothetical protein
MQSLDGDGAFGFGLFKLSCILFIYRTVLYHMDAVLGLLAGVGVAFVV